MKKTGFIIVLVAAAGIVSGIVLLYTKLMDRLEKLRDELQKQREFYTVLVRWIQLHNEGKRITEYLIDHGYKKVAIYGMKELGQCLFDEINASDNVCVGAIIDKNENFEYGGLKTVSPDADLGDIDVVIITAIHYYGEIEDYLSDKVECPIISIEDALFG